MSQPPDGTLNQARTGLQESPRKGEKIGSTVLEGDSDLSKSEEAPLLEGGNLKKQSFLQKLSQIINLPGIWLFLQVLFVSHAIFLLLIPATLCCLASRLLRLTCAC